MLPEGPGEEPCVSNSPPSSSMPASGWPALVAGPIAGLTSRFVFYPGDTIKARLQVQRCFEGTPPYRGTTHAFLKVARTEGLQGFYRGFGAVVVASVPANMAYFGGYELGKRLIPESWGMGGDMCVGAIAQLCGGLLFTPMDIIKERMQVQGIMANKQLSHRSSWHALSSMVAAGGVTGLFRGYWVTNAVWIPWSIFHISLYESFKRNASQVLSAPSQSTDNQEDLAPSSARSTNTMLPDSKLPELPAWALGWCSAAAAAGATFLTHPADVIKTRLQVLSATEGGASLSSWALLKSALQKEGPKVFLTGASVRILTLAPGSAVTWMVYEPLKVFLDGLQQ